MSGPASNLCLDLEPDGARWSFVTTAREQKHKIGKTMKHIYILHTGNQRLLASRDAVEGFWLTGSRDDCTETEQHCTNKRFLECG